AALALLALAAPALAGGWAVITLDSLPRDVRTGQSLHIGFVIRQHGRDPVNTDWNGHALRPTLTGHKQPDASGVANAADGETIPAEARQEGPVGHFVVDWVFPSAGTWAWEISAPPFTIQGDRQGDSAVFAPLTVLPASAAAPPPAERAPATVL